MGLSRKEKVFNHIKRLQIMRVPFLQYKGALEGYAAIGLIKYADVLDMLDEYKDKCIIDNDLYEEV